MTIEADIALLQRLGQAAMDAIRPFFRSGAAVEQKDDLTPVTAADRAAEDTIRRLLARDRPADGILGEEYGLVPGTSGRLWVVDPIDGTRGFVAGRPLWGTLIGLIEGGRPILGLVASGTGDRWLGCTVGTPRTLMNGKPVRVRACASLAQVRAATTHPAAFSAAGHAAFQRVGRSVADMLFGGDCHNYGLLAAGHLDLVMEEGLKPWDWAALVPVVEGAGGLMTDWAGAPLDLRSEGKVLAVGDRRVLDAVLARL